MSNALINLVPVLDGTNYQVWSQTMKAYLRSQDLSIWDKVAALPTAAALWTQLENDYSVISPTVVFEFYKKSTTFKIDPKRQPCPQIEYLEGLYTHLAAETVDIPDFV